MAKESKRHRELREELERYAQSLIAEYERTHKDEGPIHKNPLCRDDEQLFNSMEGHYQSDNEELFFKNIKYKQQYEPTLCNDLILSEHTNDDEVYLVRVEYEEYLVGRGAPDDRTEFHVMTLSEALAINLKDLGCGKDITLFEWLRTRDYEGVRYDGNRDPKF